MVVWIQRKDFGQQLIPRRISMLKTVLVFAGGLVVGALGAAYLRGLNQGYERGRNESGSDANTDNENSAAASAAAEA
jgi:hypothetical protein